MKDWSGKNTASESLPARTCNKCDEYFVPKTKYFITCDRCRHENSNLDLDDYNIHVSVDSLFDVEEFY